MINAAGILILNEAKQALFLKRGPGGDYPGYWCVPGGRAEAGETAIVAAIRETKEEAGFTAKEKDLRLWTRTVAPQMSADGASPTPPMDNVDFTTYLMTGAKSFEPVLCDEHVAFAWAPVTDPPLPLHPGVQVSLARFGMNELDVARSMAAGQLTSPQRYAPNLMLFDIRVTGTGLAYRLGNDEHVWRDPAIYLNQEFCDRCAGLPVIFEHPPENALTSKEYKRRNVGSIMFAYIKGDEVWAIARIYDDGAIKLMEEDRLSTSPGVTWRGIEVGEKLTTESGKVYMIENTPSLLDHLAICERGVWDKGKEPTGVASIHTRGDSAMDEATKAMIAQAAKDAVEASNVKIMEGVNAATAGVTALLARMDAEDAKREDSRKDAARKDAMARCDSFKFGARGDSESDEDVKKRLDAEEEKLRADMVEAGEPEAMAVDKAKKRRGDAEEEMKTKGDNDDADKARKDAEEAAKKEADERNDSVAKLTKDLNETRLALAEIRTALPRALTDDEVKEFSTIQARYDSVYSAFGLNARRPMQGETPLAYRRSLAEGLQKHDTHWKDANLVVHAVDSVGFSVIENQILASASAIAMSPASAEPGTLRPIVRTLPSGHTETRYVGEASAWLGNFAPTGNAVKDWKNMKGNQ